MKIVEHTKSIARSQDFDSVKCTIDAEDMRYISSLLRNNYSDTILATIRETYANAVDATLDNGYAESMIEVTLPNILNSTFSVRDFGRGLSRDEIFNLYSKYGKSTKRNSNEAIGGFGIGRFAPLSYNKDGFSVTSFLNREKRIYLVYISEENDTKIDEVYVGQSDERNGIMISVAVSNSDISAFVEKVRSFFTYFDNLPKFIGQEITINKSKNVLSGDYWSVEDGGKHIYNNRNHQIIIGGISYPLNPNLVKLTKSVWCHQVNNLVIKVPIGSVSIHHSRESLEYNTKTQQYIDDLYSKIEVEICAQIKNHFAEIDCLKKAKMLYHSLSLSFRGTNVLDTLHSSNVIDFHGVDITLRHFNNLIFEHEGSRTRVPVTINHIYKNDSGRVSFGKAYQVDSGEKSCYVLHDMSDGEKVVNRIYSLFDKYDFVYLFRHNNESLSRSKMDGVAKFCELNRFDLIKNDLFKLSDLQPRKIEAYSKKKTASIKSNYFLKVSQRGNLEEVSQNELNDPSITNVFFEIRDRKPESTKYDFLSTTNTRYYNEVRTDLINSLKSAFSTECNPISAYGVSVAVANSKKMKNMKNFVELKTFIKNKWENYSEKAKSAIKENVKLCTESDESKYKWLKIHVSDLDILKKFEDKIIKAEANLNTCGVSQEEIKFWTCAVNLGDKIGIDFEVKKADDFEDFMDKLDKRYPVIDTFYELEQRTYGTALQKLEKNLKHYLVLEAKNS